MIGTRLGNWILEEELGHGGMGEVYLARRVEPAGPGEPAVAAVKVLSPALSRETGFLYRFQREIDALARLDHPNIVRFYEAGDQDGHYFYAMEYVDGRNFEELLHERGRFPWREVVDMALQVCPALKHAHDHGIIHRDIKPHNLLRTDDGVVKLTDFGIAKVFAAQQLTATGGLVGTAEYLSPEQGAGKPVTPRSDLYSFGVLLYTLLTGRNPFEGESAVELMHKHRFGRFERPQRLVPEVPAEVDEIVCRLLEKEPGHRPANAYLLQRELEAALQKDRRREERSARTPESSAEADEPADRRPAGGPGPATFASRVVREELERQAAGGPVARFFNQPVVIVTLLGLCVGTAVWLWPRSGPSAASLFDSGKGLMESDDPADWDRAWTLYLDPLERKYPGHPYRAEVERFRQQKEGYDLLARALDRGGKAGPQAQGQRFFLRGLHLYEAGDVVGARAVWQALVDGYAGVDAEARWVRLARVGLKRLGAAAAADPTSTQEALGSASKLAAEGRAEQAESIWRGLEALFRDDPARTDVLETIRRDRARAAAGRR